MNRHHPILAALAAAAALLLVPAATAQDQRPQRPPTPAELQPQSVCPISGEVLTGDEQEATVVYEGQRVRLCCKKCVEKFNAFPDGALYALYRAGQKPENVQTTCPVSGEQLDADAVSVWVMNKELKVCCKKCAAKVAKDPAAWFDKLEGRHAQTKCPVKGGDIDPKVFSVVQGQKVFYCCPGCDKKMQADPDAFFAAAAKDGTVFQPATDICPVMEDPIEDRNWWVTYQGRRIFFCCRKCIGRFVKDPKKYLTEI